MLNGNASAGVQLRGNGASLTRHAVSFAPRLANLGKVQAVIRFGDGKTDACTSVEAP